MTGAEEDISLIGTRASANTPPHRLAPWSEGPHRPRVRDNAGLAASCQLFLQYSMMAVVAGLLAPLLWDSLSHLALGCGALTCISRTLLLWQRYAKYKAKEASAT